jgi:NAD(P)-dependent dehydrogenase (short-subunit alcohol dehydrogenase family)
VSDVASPSPHPADARHLLVIGAGPGIGAATARRFARDGYRVTLAARHRDKLEELAADLRPTGAEVAIMRGDAADPGQLREALTSLYAAPNPPGVVLYNVAQLTPDDLCRPRPRTCWAPTPSTSSARWWPPRSRCRPCEPPAAARC